MRHPLSLGKIESTDYNVFVKKLFYTDRKREREGGCAGSDELLAGPFSPADYKKAGLHDLLFLLRIIFSFIVLCY